MAVLFSHITLSADNGSTETFLCSGIPETESGLENWKTYQDFLEDNPKIESINVAVKSFVYGDGDIVDANEYEIAYFTKRGEDFINRSTVKPFGESNFIILTDNEEMIQGEIVDFSDECQIVLPNEPIDCSRLGYFDELEYDCWSLVEKYAGQLGIKIISDEPKESRISFDIAKGIQDYILDKFIEAGADIRFSPEELEETEGPVMGM